MSFSQFDEVINEVIFQVIESEKYSFSDPKTEKLVNLAKKVAETDVTVFIHGPTGTGKEVISNFIHQNSKEMKNLLWQLIVLQSPKICLRLCFWT